MKIADLGVNSIVSSQTRNTLFQHVSLSFIVTIGRFGMNINTNEINRRKYPMFTAHYHVINAHDNILRCS